MSNLFAKSANFICRKFRIRNRLEVYTGEPKGVPGMIFVRERENLEKLAAWEMSDYLKLALSCLDNGIPVDIEIAGAVWRASHYERHSGGVYTVFVDPSPAANGTAFLHASSEIPAPSNIIPFYVPNTDYDYTAERKRADAQE